MKKRKLMCSILLILFKLANSGKFNIRGMTLLYLLPASICNDIEKNVRYCGSNIRGEGKENIMNSIEACRADCDENDKCVGWTWFSPDSKGNRTNQCWLKTAINEKMTQEGVFSERKCAGQ